MRAVIKNSSSKTRKLREFFCGNLSDHELIWGVLHIKIIECQGLRNKDKNTFRSIACVPDLSDPYVTAWLGDYRLLKTRTINNDLDPVFNEDFYCPVAHVTNGILFKVYDQDRFYDDKLGKYFLPIMELIKTAGNCGVVTDGKIHPEDLMRVGVHKVVHLDGKKSHGSLEFFAEFIPVHLIEHTVEVPGLYFKKSEGNEVQFYMNADDNGSSPDVRYGGPNDDEKLWKPPRLWRDIYDAICNARHLIYIVGWSVDVEQYLLRGAELEEAKQTGKYSPRIGDLLIQKSEEGVVVNLMQWDDYTSNFFFPGMMGSHDEKSRAFFASTKVNSVFVHTVGGSSNTFSEHQNKMIGFTHHQKFVVVDAPKVNGTSLELKAFIGGIDLTEGRWDNNTHPLFRTLRHEHKTDAYNGCFLFGRSPVIAGPREPWHDIHSCVTGPEAINIVQAFSERWMRQAPNLSGELINLRNLMLDSPGALQKEGGYCAQTSRSIDGRVNYFDRSVRQTEKNLRTSLMASSAWQIVDEPNTELSRRFESTSGKIDFTRVLDYKKGRPVDSSIHTTMIHHIRRAKHFIYIESQYFMGSSFMWSNSSDRKVRCNNLVPAEITLKICSKIAAGEKFSVYILLPMWPEGVAGSKQVQDIIYWQRSTIESMFKKVHAALVQRMQQSIGENSKCSDYLNFYCLGTREAPSTIRLGIPSSKDERILALTRRHQVYVHSKMMIVDDEVACIGSANINQRSLDGCRDSEIMTTYWHEDHLATDESIAHHDIHGYRLHIWASLTGLMDNSFRNPSDRECVKLMNSIASRNWEIYLAEEPVDMTSHLLPSPFEFIVENGNEGELRPRRGLYKGRFPDTHGNVLGARWKLLPEMLTT